MSGLGLATGLLDGAIGNITDQSNMALQNQYNQQFAQQQQDWNKQQWYDQNRWNVSMWRSQNNYNERWWDKQNKYNLDLWNMQNKYNSPIEQMARLKEAGLNPHLMYQKGNTGPASSINATQQRAEGLKSPDVKGYTRPEADSVSRGFTAFTDAVRLGLTEAQTDNVEAQTDVAAQDALLKAQQTINAAITGEKGKIDLYVADELKDTSVQVGKLAAETAAQTVRKTTADAEVAVKTKNSRINLVKQELKKKMAETKGQLKLNDIRELERELKEKGVENAGPIVRMLYRAWQSGNLDPSFSGTLGPWLTLPQGWDSGIDK